MPSILKQWRIKNFFLLYQAGRFYVLDQLFNKKPHITILIFAPSKIMAIFTKKPEIKNFFETGSNIIHKVKTLIYFIHFFFLIFF